MQWHKRRCNKQSRFTPALHERARSQACSLRSARGWHQSTRLVARDPPAHSEWKGTDLGCGFKGVRAHFGDAAEFPAPAVPAGARLASRTGALPTLRIPDQEGFQDYSRSRNNQVSAGPGTPMAPSRSCRGRSGPCHRGC